MSTVVTVMDRGGWEANTDNIVVADPTSRRLTWVPRDLWAESIRFRVNKAYARGGHEALAAALADLGLPVEHGLCLRREATERALAGAEVTVPVREPLRFWYPLEPNADIEQGRKPISFDPPEETLRGERIHQWLGARYRREGTSRLPDVERLQRQQVFVRALLEQGFDFRGAVEVDPSLVRASGPEAFEEMSRVDGSWCFETVDDVAAATIDGMMVLVRASHPRISRLWGRVTPGRRRRRVRRGRGAA